MNKGSFEVHRFRKMWVLIKVASYILSIFNHIPEIIDANQIAMDDRLTTLKNIIKIYEKL